MNDNRSITSETSKQLEHGKLQEEDEDAYNTIDSPTSIPPTPTPTPIIISDPKANKKDKKKPAIRHAEKPRTSTCRFADRVAKLSIQQYNSTIPIEQRPPQTCIATILAHYYPKNKDDDDDNRGKNDLDWDKSGGNPAPGTMWILGMGVGTKFLSESSLRQEVEHEHQFGYGSRVRDMHAEILARRAFRRQLTLEIQEDLRLLEIKEAGSEMDMDNITPQSDYCFGRVNVKSKHRKHNNLSVLVRSTTEAPLGNNDDNDSAIRYKLRPGVTLHMYTSSAPCGNATLKKFCKMSKERFREELGPDEWPETKHDPPPGHSIKLGEFSLLVKKNNENNDAGTMEGNNNNNNSNNNNNNHNNVMVVGVGANASSDCSKRKNEDKPTNEAGASQMDQDIMDLFKTKKRTKPQEESSSSSQKPQSFQPKKRRGKPWPATLSDGWAPPGTTIVGFKHKGSIHTCSDKICRWNYLGLQGSLLAGMLEEPLYLSTLTVGRKLSGAVCRRAICCRLDTRCRQPKVTQSKSPAGSNNDNQIMNENKYRVNHPAVMGTSVCLSTGVVDTSNIDAIGQDVRFHSSVVWTWWPGVGEFWNTTEIHADDSDNGFIESIESSTGLLATTSSEEHRDNQQVDKGEIRSVAPKVSTKELISLFLQVYHRAVAKKNNSSNPSRYKRKERNSNEGIGHGRTRNESTLSFNNTLSGIREIKNRCSSKHESFKNLLLTEHKVLSQWQRREDREQKCSYCTDN